MCITTVCVYVRTPPAYATTHRSWPERERGKWSDPRGDSRKDLIDVYPVESGVYDKERGRKERPLSPMHQRTIFRTLNWTDLRMPPASLRLSLLDRCLVMILSFRMVVFGVINGSFLKCLLNVLSVLYGFQVRSFDLYHNTMRISFENSQVRYQDWMKERGNWKRAKCPFNPPYLTSKRHECPQ